MKSLTYSHLKFQVLLFTCIVLAVSVLKAQNNVRSYVSYSMSDGAAIINVSDGAYKIVPYTNQIVHTTFLPSGIQVKNFSFAASLMPGKMGFSVEEPENGNLILSTQGIHVVIEKNPFRIAYFFEGKELISEQKGYFRTDSLQGTTLSISPEEVLYGGGTRVLGMNRRGNKLEMYNRAHYGYETHSVLMNYTMPLVISSKKYALLFDNASVGTLDLDSEKNNTITYQTMSGTINYFVVAGSSWYNLNSEYTLLTGRQPLPPRWAFGNFSSRFGYHSQKEVMQTVDKFISDGIPLDAVIIDIYWFGPGIFGHMGNLDWYRDSFPQPEQMIADLKSKGIKTILVTEPFILTTSKRWQEAVDNKVLGLDKDGNPYRFDFYFGNTGLVDLYKPEARDWFWNIYKQFTKQGIAGWWGDLGEPEVHPAGLQHAIGSANEIHNAYGHEWAKMFFEGYKKDFPENRPFILMRSGYAGSQRYGMIPWTGDVSRSWGGLVPQVELALQMGMQGMAYLHSDLGGFAGGDSLNNELYIRWLQYGVFQPIYRPHAQEQIPSEPVFQNENTKANVKKHIELRYRLMPYNYTLAFENNQTGIPFMRPLFYTEPGNANLLTYDKAYMWGDAFLVSPIKAAGVKEQSIYFPAGSNWYHFFTGQKFIGGTEQTCSVDMSGIPVFVKGGSFVPMLPKAENTEKYSLSEFCMHYYFDASANNVKYRLYNDDGTTPDAFEKNMYQFIHFEANTTPKSLIVVVKKENAGNFKSDSDYKMKFVIHNLIKNPKKVYVNGKKLKASDYSFNAEHNTLALYINVGLAPVTIEVK